MNPEIKIRKGLLRSGVSLLFCIILAIACREDFAFEPEDTVSDQISLVSEISPTGAVEAKVLRSTLLGGKAQLLPLDDAQLSFQVERPDQAIMPMIYKKEKERFELADENYRVIEGGYYGIRASFSNVPDTVKAITFIPKAVNIESYRTESVDSYNVGKDLKNYLIRLNVKLQDTKELPAFFQLLVYRIKSDFVVNAKGDTTFVDYKDFELMRMNPALSPRNAVSTFVHKEGAFVDHSKLNKSAITLTVETQNPLKSVNETIRKLMIEVRTLSPEMYFYNQYLNNQILSNRTNYSYPVTSYSNVQNGLGVFAGFNTARIIVEL